MEEQKSLEQFFKSEENSGTPPDPKPSLISRLSKLSGEDVIRKGTPIPLNPSQTGSINVGQYQPYMKNVTGDLDTLNRIRAANQSTGEKWYNFAHRFVVGELVGGTINAFGTLPELVDMVFTGNTEFENRIMQFGDAITEASTEEHPIYRKNPGKYFDTSDLAWWLEGGVSMASTISLLVPALATTKGLSMLGQASNKLAALARINATTKAGKTAANALFVGRKARELGKVFATASVMRNAENMKEGFHVVEQTRKEANQLFQNEAEYQKALNSEVGQEYQRETDLPKSKEGLAAYIAGKAGWRSYVVNSANIVFDLFQAGALMKTNYFTRTGKFVTPSKIVEATTGKTLGKFEKFTRDYLAPFSLVGAEAGTEAIEEAVNYIGGEEGLRYGKQLQGQDVGEDDVMTRVKKYVDNPALKEASFFGFLGGLGFSGVSRAAVLLDRKDGNRDIKMKLADINARKGHLDLFHGEVGQIKKDLEDNVISKNVADLKLAEAKTKLASTMGVSAAQSGNVDNLLEWLDLPETRTAMIKDMNSDEIKLEGVTGVDKQIANTKRDVLTAERAYKRAVNKFYHRNDIRKDARAALINAYTASDTAQQNNERQSVEYSNAVTAELEQSNSYRKSVAKGNPVQTTLDIEILRVMSASLEGQKDSEDTKAYFDEQLALLEKQVEGVKPFATKKILTSDVQEMIMLKWRSNAQAQFALESKNDLVEEATIKKVNETAIEIEKQTEKAAEDKAYNSFVDNVNTSLQGLTDDQKLVSLRAERGRQTEKKYTDWLDRRIKLIEDVKRTAARQTPTAPVEDEELAKITNIATTPLPSTPVGQPAIPVPPYKKDADFGKALLPVDMTALANSFANDAEFKTFVDQVTGIYEHAGAGYDFKLRELERLANESNNKLASDFINNTALKLREETIFNERNQHNSIKAGNVYSHNERAGTTYTVLSIFENGVGTTIIKANKVDSTGEKIITFPVEMMHKLTQVKEATPDRLHTILVAAPGQDPTIMSDVMGLIDETQTPLVALLTNKLNHEIIVEFSNSGAMKNTPLRYTKSSKKLTVNPALLKKMTADELAEAIAHEFVHALRAGTPGRAKQDKLLTETRMLLNAQLEANPPKSERVKQIIDIVNASPIEELLAYSLTNTEFFMYIINSNAVVTFKQALQLPNFEWSARAAATIFNTINEPDTVNYTPTQKTVNEYANDPDLFSQPFEAVDSHNIFIPAVDAVNPETGKVDIDYYNKKHGAREYLPKLTQKQLEDMVKIVFTSEFNTGSFVELKYYTRNGYDGIGIYYDGVEIGYVVPYEGQKALVEYLEELNAQTDPSSIKIPDNRTLAGFARRKIAELEGKGQNKPFSSELELQKKQLESSFIITQAINKGANTLTVRITRKSSGNVLNTELKPVNEIFGEQDEVFYTGHAQTETDELGIERNELVSSKDGRKFEKISDKPSHANADGRYTGGYSYYLATMPNTTNERTKVPIPLTTSTLPIDMGNDVATILNKLIQRGKELNAKGLAKSDIIADEEMRNLIYGTPTEPGIADYFPVVDVNKKNVKNYFSFTDDGFIFSSGALHYRVIYKGKTGKTILMTLSDRGKQSNLVPLSYKENQVTDDRGRASNYVSPETNKKVFWGIIKDALSAKKVNINHKRMEQNTPFKGEKNYLTWLQKNKLLLIDVDVVKNSKGTVIKDSNGNPIIIITNKTQNDAKNSNFVVSVDTSTIGYSNAEASTTTQDQGTETISDTRIEPEKIKNAPQSESINTLLEKGTVEVDSLEQAIQITSNEDVKVLLGGKLIGIQQKGDKIVLTVENFKGRTKLKKEEHAKLELMDKDQAKDWWKKTFSDFVDLNIHPELGELTRQGVQAWAVFEDAMVNMGNRAVKGTQYHEAFHVVFWLYRSEAQRTKILDEARAKYGNIGDIALEEALADEFEQFMLKNGETDEVAGETTKSFFRQLLDLITNFFKAIGGRLSESRTNQLFYAIRNGEFAYKPDARLVEYAKKNISRTKRINGFSPRETNDLINYLSKVALDLLTKESNVDNKISTIKDSVRQAVQFDAMYNAVGHGKMNLIKATIGEQFDDLWKRTEEHLSRQFGMEVSGDILLNDIPLLDKPWDSSDAFKSSKKDTIGNLIKRVIMTTEGDINEPNVTTGMVDYIDFNKVYPSIERNMRGTYDVNEMMSRLRNMGHFNLVFHNLANRIESDENLRNAWTTVFAKQSPDVDIILISGERVKVDVANKATSHYILSNEWIDVFLSKLEEGHYTEAVMNDVRENVFKKLRALTNDEPSFYKNLNEISELVSKGLDTFGVSISAKYVGKILSNPVYMAHYKGGAKEVYDRLFHSFFVNAGRSINDYNKKKVSEEEYIFREHSNFNEVANAATLFNYDRIESVYQDINNNNNYVVREPNYLSMFFNKFKATVDMIQVDKEGAKWELVRLIREFAQDKRFAHSVWLWGDAKTGIPGILYEVEDRTNLDKIGPETLNLEFIRNFTYSAFGGIKNQSSREGVEYSKMTDKDWAMSNVIMYLQGVEDGFIKVPILNPADLGNTYHIQVPRISGLTEKGALPIDANRYNNALIKAVHNTIMQEINAMQVARDLFFVQGGANGNNELVLKTHKDINASDFQSAIHLDYRTLQEHYHFKDKDKNGLPILMQNGKLTGRVWQFHGVTTLNEDTKLLNDLFTNGVPNLDKENDNTVQRIENRLEKHAINWIKEIKNDTYQAYKHLRNTIETVDGFGNYNDFLKFITEFGVNHYIHNFEQANFLTGPASEYKNWTDTNKRAKEVASPKTIIGGGINDTFTGFVIEDPKITSPFYTEIVNIITAKQKKLNTAFKGMKVDMNKMIDKDADVDKMNPLEQSVHKVTSGYLETMIGDGQGYVTLDFYEKMLKYSGRWNDKMKRLMQLARTRGRKMNIAELDAFLQPLKPFAFQNRFNSGIQKMMATQLKYSVIPMIPAMVENTEAEAIMDFMEDNGVDQLFFKSSQKVGNTHVPKIVKDDGKVDMELLSQYTADKYQHRLYSMADWGLQLDNPDHLRDSVNKLGTQIVKNVLSNINPRSKFNIGGRIYYGRNDKNKDKSLFHHFHRLMAENIKEDSDALLVEMGVTVNEDGTYTTPNIEKVQEVLMREVLNRGLNQNYAEAVKLVDGQFNLPLFISVLENKWESILSSMFTNNVTEQKQPGGSAVIMSNAFFRNPYKKLKIADGQMLLDVGVDGITWTKEKAATGDTELKVIKDENGAVIFEALIPPFSGLLYDENGQIDIDSIPPEVMQQVWYRIPNEGNHGTSIIKVVGLLPDTMGATLMLPSEAITVTGEDFDNDKRYGMIRKMFKNIEGDLQVYKWYDNANDAAYEQWRRDYKGREHKRTLIENPNSLVERYNEKIESTKDTRITLGELAKQAYEASQEQMEQNEVVANNLIALANTRFQYAFENLGEVIETFKAEIRELDYEVTINKLTLEGLAPNDNNYNTVAEALAISEQALEDYNNDLQIIYNVTKEGGARQRELGRASTRYKVSKERINEIVTTLIEKRNAATERELRKQFNALDVYQRNIKNVHTNEIQTVIEAIMLHSDTQGENLSPSGFPDGIAIIEELDKLKGRKKDYNTHLVTTQDLFRSRNVDGLVMKGMASDAVVFLNVAQNSKMELSTTGEDYSFLIKYDASEVNYDELVKKHGKEAITQDGKFIYVKHKRLAWNIDDTFTNIKGELTTKHTSQVLSQILDIVKHGLPDNVNRYTLYPYVTMMATGISLRYSSLFIAQPVLMDLSEAFFDNQTVIEDGGTYEFKVVRNKYQDAYRNLTGSRSNYVVPKEKIAFTEKEMAAMIKFEADNGGLYGIVNKADKKKAQKYIENQLHLLEMYSTYKKSGDAYNKMIQVLSMDRKSIGPELSKVLSLAHQLDETAMGSTLSMEARNGVATVDKNERKRRKLKSSTNPVSKVRPSKEVSIEKGEGAIIKVKVGTDKIPAVMAVLPKHYGLTHDSTYPVMEAYWESGNKRAFDVLSPLFMKHSLGVIEFANLVSSKLGIRYNDQFHKQVSDFIKALIVEDLDFYKGVDLQRLIGTGGAKIAFEINDEWSNLSVVNKIALIKQKYSEKLAERPHILNYFEPKLNSRVVKERGMHTMNFVGTNVDNVLDEELIESFMNMWLGDESIFEPQDIEIVKDMARDMIQYSIATTGLTMKRNSFAHLIPVEILKEIGLDSYMTEMKELTDYNDYFTHYQNDLVEKFAQFYHYNRDVVPAVNPDSRIAEKFTVDPADKIAYISETDFQYLPAKIANATYITIPRKYGNKMIVGPLYKNIGVTNNGITYVPINKLGNPFLNELTDHSILQGNNADLSIDFYSGFSTSLKAQSNLKGELYPAYGSPEGKVMWSIASHFIGEELFSVPYSPVTQHVNDFKDAANVDEYNEGDLVMIKGQTTKGEVTKAELRSVMIKDGKLQGEYAKVYKVLKANATVMVSSDIDSYGNRRVSYNPAYEIGDSIIREHLDTFVPAQLTKHVENGIAYYGKDLSKFESASVKFRQLIEKDEQKGHDEDTKCAI